MHSDSAYKKFTDIDAWIISRLKRESSVALVIMADEYARERNIKLRSARRVLERRLKILAEQGIVERLPTYPVSFKLKKLPIEYFSSKSEDFQTCDCFDLSLNSRIRKTLGKRLVVSQKITSSGNSAKELRKNHLRVIRRANAFRQRALLIAQHKASIRPGTREHADIAFLYSENVKEWDRSVMVFMNDDEEFMITNVRTRFNDEKKALWNYLKSEKALKIAFKRHKDAIMITLTIPHIFPLVIPLENLENNGKIIGFIPLQDSIITQLKNNMLAWLRRIWKGRKIETFTAYEYHTDYNLHIHILIFGIPYLIDWSRRMKGKEALTYYLDNYNIPLPSELETKMKEGKLEPKDKTLISKHIFTALLDMWLQKILFRFDSVLHMNLLQAYLEYKRKEKLQGPVNEIHRIKDGKWKGKPPKDALLQYSSGAAYMKVLSPDRYVTKYVLKIFEMIKGGGGGGIDEKDQAKVYGYWLFGKRFNSYSPSLLPPMKKEKEESVWHFVGVFNQLDLPDYIMDNIILDVRDW